MANKIQIAYDATGSNLYALVRDADGLVWNGSSFEAYVTANLGNYDIALTEQGTASRYYTADFPSVVAGIYAVIIYRRTGGSPAETDTPLTGGSIEWDGTVVSTVQSTIVANHLDHLLAADYNPAAKPGVATALLNELIGDDGGVSQFTANALELAPTGGSAPTVAQIRAEMDANSTKLATIASAVGVGGISLDILERFEKSSTAAVYTIEMRTYNSTGTLTTADSTPTLTATGSITGSLAANLSAATTPSTGVYRWTYSVPTTHPREEVRWDGAATVATVIFNLSKRTQVSDGVRAILESGLTYQESEAVKEALMAGKMTPTTLGTTKTIVYRNKADTINRATVTFDTILKRRTGVVFDFSDLV